MREILRHQDGVVIFSTMAVERILIIALCLLIVWVLRRQPWAVTNLQGKKEEKQSQGGKATGHEAKTSPNRTKFSFNQVNRYISWFQETFTGYLWCGLVLYKFAGYPGNHNCNPSLRMLFFQELTTHVPRIRLMATNTRIHFVPNPKLGKKN